MRIFLLLAASLCAQDADLVLRTAVSYNTQRATLTLSEAQQDEAGQLAATAQAAARSGNFKQAMHEYSHGFAVMRGIPWTPAVQLASALEAKLDDAIADPGQTVQLTLEALFPADAMAKTPFHLSLRSLPNGMDVPIEAPTEVKASELPLKIAVKLTTDAPGNYVLTADAGVLKKTVPLRVEALEGEAVKLAARVKKQSLPAAEYVLTLYRKAEAGKANPHRFEFARMFAEANQLLDTAATGKNPFEGRKGELRLAYRSAVDQTLQPYRLFVPAKYEGKPLPLVVALHGMGGDESSMMEGYAGTMKREAERWGFFLVTPKGREPASMYRGTAEKDVMDVLAEVEKAYRIDAKRIYLMGHSMGGYGTWSIAMAYPGKFAALGPIAGGGNPQGMEKIKDIPQFVVHGDRDKTVPVMQSRTMVEAGKKAGATIEYIEVRGGNHVDIAVPNMPGMLDFFARQARP